jgi:hypothetical protein
MKMILCLHLFLVFLMTSCLETTEKTADKSKQNKTELEQKNITPTKVKNLILDQDCPVKGLAGVMIQDTESTSVLQTQLLWEEIKKNSAQKNFPQGVFLNANKTLVLKFISHPGAQRYQISEFEMSKARRVDLSLPILEKIQKAKTDNGLYIGQSFNEVKTVLKDVHGLNIADDSISLRIENMDPTKSECLKKHNMPIYYLEINFDESNKMDALKFGYEYP